MENYFPDGVPSTVLAIVQANANEEASLYTSSNNSPVNPGQTEEQGAAVPEGYTYITVNGDYNISSYAYTYVNVPGETKFGYAYITENGDYDIASYECVNVDVPGQNIDPVYGEQLSILNAIEEDVFPVTADLCQTNVSSDFWCESEDDGDGNTIVTLASWKQVVNVDETDYTIQVAVECDSDLYGNTTGVINEAGTFYNELDVYPDLYGEYIYPTLIDVTMTKSSNPSEDEYDYLIVGKLYSWNMRPIEMPVDLITENGFYPTNGQLGFEVYVEGGSTGLGFPMLMFKEWGFENWRYAVAEDNNLTISFGLNDQASNKMVDYVAVSSFNGENVDRMTLKPLSIDCSSAARENWPGSYSGLDYYYWSNAPADPEAEGYHYDSNADTVVSFFELTNLEDPVSGDTFEGEVTVNLSYNTTTGVWSATWDEVVEP